MALSLILRQSQMKNIEVIQKEVETNLIKQPDQLDQTKSISEDLNHLRMRQTLKLQIKTNLADAIKQTYENA